MQYIKRFAKKVLPKKLTCCLKILFASDAVIENCFKTSRPQRVLLSYITEPFSASGFASHTNRQECLAIAKIFNEMGYSVDVVPYFSERAIDFSRYSCIFGFGTPLCASFRHNDPNLMRIHYATGAHVSHQNSATLARAAEVHLKRGVWLLDSSRVVEKTWSEQTTLVDAIIVLGGSWTAQTYRKHYGGPIVMLPPTFNAALPLEHLERKDFASARNNYLWFGGSGAVHKGLDLLLEVFASTPEKFLHIVGPVDHEPGFLLAYARELALPNIFSYGFVNVHSKIFADLIHRCAFCVFPSCSEGMPTSLVNAMCNGLVPVMTPECGFDYKDNAVIIDGPDINSLQQALQVCESLSLEEITAKSHKCLQDTRTNCSLEAFTEGMKKILRQLLPRMRNEA